MIGEMERRSSDADVEQPIQRDGLSGHDFAQSAAVQFGTLVILVLLALLVLWIASSLISLD